MRSPGKPRNKRLDLANVLGYFLPASRVLHVDVPNSVIKSISDQRVLPRPLPWQSLQENIYAATLLHEEIHFIQSVATSVGVVESELEFAKTRALQQFCSRLRAIGHPTIPIPLTGARPGVDVPVQLTADLGEYKKCLSTIERFEEHLRGGSEQYQSATRRLLPDLGRYWQSLGLGLRYDRLIFGEIDWPSDPELLSGPIVMSQSGDYLDYLGSEQLYESWANTTELLFLRMSTEWGEFERLWHERYFGSYKVAFAMLNFSCPDFFNMGYQSNFLNTSAICDVALTPSLATSEYEASQRVLWRDIHPGWRLLSIVNTIRDHKVRPVDLANLPGDYLRFVAEICDRNRWPHPFKQALTASTDNLSSEIPDSQVHDYEKYSFGYHRKAFSVRHAIPHAIPFHPVRIAGEYEWDPISIVPDIMLFRDGFSYRGALEPKPDIPKLFEHYVASIFCALVANGGERFSNTELLDSVLPDKLNVMDRNSRHQLAGAIAEGVCRVYSGYGPESVVPIRDA